MSKLRSRIKVPAKKPRTWQASLIRKRGQILGDVEAPDAKAAELAAVRQFSLNEEQRSKRLLVRERG